MIKWLYNIKTDKLLHFIASLGVMQVSYGILHYFLLDKWSLLIALGIAILVGVFKELYDKKKGGIFNKEDIIADTIGTLIGFILTIIIIM